MKTKEIINKALTELKRLGYVQVSSAEMANKTGLSTRAVVASLKRSGLPNFKRGNEVFFRLEQVQAVNFTSLSIQSPILREIENE